MDLATVSALPSLLPRWHKKLAFINCQWPLGPVAYSVLGYNIPTTYDLWILVGGHKEQTVTCMCEGAKARRLEQGDIEPLSVFTDTLPGGKVKQFGGIKVLAWRQIFRFQFDWPA